MRSALHKYAAMDAQSAELQPAIMANCRPSVYCATRF